MSTDSDLLRRYAGERSESAFGELVLRHVDLVYSTALREANGNASAAEDITQAVFTELATSARRLTRHPALAGWLYTSVRHVAANLRRAEQRRHRREQEVQSMNELLSSEPNDITWRELRPVLDDAMHELSETDRAAVVLRFFEERSLKEVGLALGLNENAARMRVERALEKLRTRLAKRGISSTTSGLAATLAASAVLSAPTSLAATVTSAALAATTCTATSTAVTFLQIMSATKLKIGAITALVSAAVALPVWQQSRITRLTSENTELRIESAKMPPLQRELERLRKIEVDHAELDRLRGLQSEVLKLRARVNSNQRTENEVAQLKSALNRQKNDGAPTNQFSGALGDFAKGMIEQQLQGRLARMKTKLNLTPAQEQGIAAIMQKQIEQGAQFAQKMFSGKLNSTEVAQAQSASHSEDQIKALLSPEQLTGYQELKQEENSANARLAANAEMLQLQSTLSLTSEQQDQVFSALYEQTMKQMSGDSGSPPKNGNVEEWLGQQLDRKVKALEGVLTPEQLEGYRRLQQGQLKMLKSIMPQGINPGGSQPAVEGNVQVIEALVPKPDPQSSGPKNR